MDDNENNSKNVDVKESEEVLYNYDYLFNRAWEKIPSLVENTERFKIPEAELFYEGKTTIIRNFMDIVQKVNRQDYVDQFYKFLLKELGTAGVIEGRRLVLNSVVDERKINERIRDYVETYVLCSECRRPDTKLEREGRVLMLVCAACGARRPVKVKKRRQKSESGTSVKVGDVMEVLIQTVGRQGDGMVRIGRFLMFIPGAARGTKLKVKVESIRGNVIIARPFEEKG